VRKGLGAFGDLGSDQQHARISDGREGLGAGVNVIDFALFARDILPDHQVVAILRYGGDARRGVGGHDVDHRSAGPDVGEIDHLAGDGGGFGHDAKHCDGGGIQIGGAILVGHLAQFEGLTMPLVVGDGCEERTHLGRAVLKLETDRACALFSLVHEGDGVALPDRRHVNGRGGGPTHTRPAIAPFIALGPFDGVGLFDYAGAFLDGDRRLAPGPGAAEEIGDFAAVEEDDRLLGQVDQAQFIEIEGTGGKVAFAGAADGDLNTVAFDLVGIELVVAGDARPTGAVKGAAVPLVHQVFTTAVEQRQLEPCPARLIVENILKAVVEFALAGAVGRIAFGGIADFIELEADMSAAGEGLFVLDVVPEADGIVLGKVIDCGGIQIEMLDLGIAAPALGVVGAVFVQHRAGAFHLGIGDVGHVDPALFGSGTGVDFIVLAAVVGFKVPVIGVRGSGVKVVDHLPECQHRQQGEDHDQ